MRILVCSSCRDETYPWREKTWRFACEPCGESFLTYHEAAFPGHVIQTLTRDEPTFEAMQKNLKVSEKAVGW